MTYYRGRAYSLAKSDSHSVFFSFLVYPSTNRKKISARYGLGRVGVSPKAAGFKYSAGDREESDVQKLTVLDDREDGFEVGNAQTIRDSDWTSPSMPRDTRDGNGVLPLSNPPPSPILPQMPRPF